MPDLYILYCDSCDYVVKGVMSQTSVIMNDGSEMVCPHPIERLTAERATGETWCDLQEANRLVYRYALACLSCGKMDYYGPHDLDRGIRADSHIGSIVHRPSLDEAKRYTCRSCGEKALYPICGRTGCLTAILNLFKIPRQTAHCALCKSGVLKSEIFGRS